MKNAANKSEASPATPPTVPPAIGPTLFEASLSPLAAGEDAVGEDVGGRIEEGEEVTKKQILSAF